MLKSVPLLAFVIIAYAVFAFAGDLFQSDWQGMERWLREPLIESTSFPPSASVENPWALGWGNLFVIIGLMLLSIEVIRATMIGTASLSNHAFSFGIMLISIFLFLLAPGFATATFFILTLMTMFDTVVGYTVTAVTARRDIGVGDGIIGGAG